MSISAKLIRLTKQLDEYIAVLTLYNSKIEGQSDNDNSTDDFALTNLLEGIRVEWLALIRIYTVDAKEYFKNIKKKTSLTDTLKQSISEAIQKIIHQESHEIGTQNIAKVQGYAKETLLLMHEALKEDLIKIKDEQQTKEYKKLTIMSLENVF